MQITLKLFATLATYAPDHACRGVALIDISPQESIHQILVRYAVPIEMVHLVLINGVYVDPKDRDKSDSLKADDALAIWPPVAGG